MKILLVTPAYAPSRGGLESVLELLVTEWRAEGCSVDIYVNGRLEPADGSPHSKSGLRTLRRIAVSSDVIVVANATLRTYPALLGLEHKTFLQHHSTYAHVAERNRVYALATRLVRRVWIRRAMNVAVSEAVERSVRRRREDWITLWNPVLIRAGLPRAPWAARGIDLLFVGRLVADKGLDLLLEALAMVDSTFRCVVVGDGPERVRLPQECVVSPVGSGTIEWLGDKDGKAVAELMAASKWVVVPSRYEPFGIVAIEALGQECGLVVSRTGGLEPLIGRVALGFEPECARSLRLALETALQAKALPLEWGEASGPLVARHRPSGVAEAYRAHMSAGSRRGRHADARLTRDELMGEGRQFRRAP